MSGSFGVHRMHDLRCVQILAIENNKQGQEDQCSEINDQGEDNAK